MKNIRILFGRLSGVATKAPQFELRWKYENVILGSGFLAKTTTSNAPVKTNRLKFVAILLTIRLLRIY